MQSTGPRTAAGKARSSFNALKHGLTAKNVVFGTEDPSEFEQLRAELIEEYEPQTVTEFELVDRLGGLFWRLRRVPRMEAETLEARAAAVAGPDQSDQFDAEERRRHEMQEIADRFIYKDKNKSTAALHREEKQETQRKDEAERRATKRAAEEERRRSNIGLALIRDSEHHDVFGKISRYEVSLMNSIARTLTIRRAIQASRLTDERDRRTIDH